VAIYLIYKGIASVNELEREVGNHKHPSPNGGESKLRCWLLLKGSDLSGLMPEAKGVQA